MMDQTLAGYKRQPVLLVIWTAFAVAMRDARLQTVPDAAHRAIWVACRGWMSFARWARF